MRIHTRIKAVYDDLTPSGSTISGETAGEYLRLSWKVLYTQIEALRQDNFFKY